MSSQSLSVLKSNGKLRKSESLLIFTVSAHTWSLTLFSWQNLGCGHFTAVSNSWSLIINVTNNILTLHSHRIFNNDFVVWPAASKEKYDRVEAEAYWTVLQTFLQERPSEDRPRSRTISLWWKWILSTEEEWVYADNAMMQIMWSCYLTLASCRLSYMTIYCES